MTLRQISVLFAFAIAGFWAWLALAQQTEHRPQRDRIAKQASDGIRKLHEVRDTLADLTDALAADETADALLLATQLNTQWQTVPLKLKLLVQKHYPKTGEVIAKAIADARLLAEIEARERKLFDAEKREVLSPSEAKAASPRKPTADKTESSAKEPVTPASANQRGNAEVPIEEALLDEASRNAEVIAEEPANKATGTSPAATSPRPEAANPAENTGDQQDKPFTLDARPNRKAHRPQRVYRDDYDLLGSIPFTPKPAMPAPPPPAPAPPVPPGAPTDNGKQAVRR